jgi:hypothetical protein
MIIADKKIAEMMAGKEARVVAMNEAYGVNELRHAELLEEVISEIRSENATFFDSLSLDDQDLGEIVDLWVEGQEEN